MFKRAVHEHIGVVRGERLELVRRRAEGQAGDLGDLLGEALPAKPARAVEPGADGGAALRQLEQIVGASP